MKTLANALFKAADFSTGVGIDIIDTYIGMQLKHPRKQQTKTELAETKATYDKVAKEMKKFHSLEKKMHSIKWVPGRMYLNSVCRPVYHCAGNLWCNPEWDEYRLWITTNGENGPTWCKMCVTLEEYQRMVIGMKYTDDPVEVERLEKEYDEYCQRWKKRQQQQIDMHAELSKPITNKNRKYINGKVRRF